MQAIPVLTHDESLHRIKQLKQQGYQVKIVEDEDGNYVIMKRKPPKKKVIRKKKIKRKLKKKY